MRLLRLRRAVRALACLVAAASVARAQVDASRVTVEHRIAISRGMAFDDARRVALEEALAEAVRRVVGTKVDAVQQSITIESGKLEERFLSVVNAGASGRVVDYTVLSEKLDQDSSARGGPVAYLTVKVDAQVAPERGLADAGFRVSLQLNGQVFLDRGTPQSSDEIVATVNATQDGYVTIFGIADDSVQVLLPNAYAKQNAVKGGEAFAFPSADQRKRLGIVVNAQVPPGRQKTTEMYVVVATRRPVPFEGPKGTQTGGVATVRGTLAALNRWLVNIPLHERAVAYAAYDVRRQVP